MMKGMGKMLKKMLIMATFADVLIWCMCADRIITLDVLGFAVGGVLIAFMLVLGFLTLHTFAMFLGGANGN